MSLIFRNLGQIPEETAHVLQNLVSANGLISVRRLLFCEGLDNATVNWIQSE